MTTPLFEPDDVHTQLLLLLAGELPAAEALALTQRIAADPAMSAEFRTLRQAEASVRNRLAALDAVTFLPLSASGAVRQYRRSAELHRQRQVVLPAEPSTAHRMHVQWWMYPTAAAALVLVSLMTWWGWHNQDVSVGGPTVVAQSQTVLQEPSAASPDASPAVAPVPPAMAVAITPASSGGASSSDGMAAPTDGDDLAGVSGISEAEQQASTLQRRSDPSTITASIFLNDPDSPVE